VIEAGTAAPDFTLPNQDGEDVTLSSLRGGPVVLYFYPKADTPCSIGSHGHTRPLAGLSASSASRRRRAARARASPRRRTSGTPSSGSAENSWRLVAVHDEIQVSGNALLEDRPGLSQAVTACLTGAADLIIGAHSERLWWGHEVRAQVLRLVEGEGCEVWAVDTGRLSNGSAAEDFNGEVRTSADRFSRRQNAEKSHGAVQRAINRGIVPWPKIPPGFDRTKDTPLVPNEDAGTVVEAFGMRLAGATIDAVRAFLSEHGVTRSYHGVQAMLRDRLYLGEIHFGSSYEPNLTAHPPIVDRDLFNAVQRVRVSRGRRAKSERLLARLGVLRCGTCGARMVVGTSNNSSYWIYRCPPVGDCERRVTISAEIVEQVVVERVRGALADVQGRASVEDNARDAELQLERAQANLNAALRAFDGFDEQAAVDRLAELRTIRDQAQERVDHLGGHRSVVTINAARDWDRLSPDARRALIRATVAEVRVAPASGGSPADRVTVELVGE
jgi:DNA invertase Pin-like site-specific DNA recombinase